MNLSLSASSCHARTQGQDIVVSTEADIKNCAHECNDGSVQLENHEIHQAYIQEK